MRTKLREVCDPNDKILRNEHKHLCEDCGTCWKHQNDIPGTTTPAQFKKAHSCPNCGRPEHWKFNANDPGDRASRVAFKELAELLTMTYDRDAA